MTELEVFTEALNQADAAARGVFLDEACRGDDELRRRLEELLALNDAEEVVLDRGIPSLVESLESGRITSGVFSEESLESATQQVLGLLEPSSEPGVMGRLGHYDVRQVLGFGGYGIVVKAFDTKLSRVVAIKLMSPGLALTSPPRRRFLREARSEAAVKHENVVQIYAVEESPIPYLVMEFVSGETLQQRFDRLGPFEASEIVRIGRQIALGLAAAHEQGLIHRDIKPSNILLEDGVYPTAKLTDFGLARTVDDASASQSGMVAGTPVYMSPEQVRGEVLDQRADLFSFGSVLYAMCTGRPPFRAPTTLAVLKRVAEDTPRPIRDVIPETPEGLCAVISRLLEKSRDDRFSTAKEAAAALATCLTDPPITLRRRKSDSRGSWWRERSHSAALRVGFVIVLGLLLTEATGLTRFFDAGRRQSESTTATNVVTTQATDPQTPVTESGNSVEPVVVLEPSLGNDLTKNPADLLTLYQAEAKRWEIWLDADKQRQATMVLKPIYLWQGAGWNGSLFVWSDEGQPVAVGGVVLDPGGERFGVVHEMHNLSPQQFFPVFRDSKRIWELRAGVSRFPLPNGPTVAATPDERTSQMESIARDFTAEAINGESRLDLQRHPQPLHRYGDSEGDVLDGALFAYVREAQGDPEIIVAVEARRVHDTVSWHFCALRFAVMHLTLDYQRERVWDSILNDPNSKFNNADNTMFAYREREIEKLPDNNGPREMKNPTDLLSLYQVEAKRWEMWLDADKQRQATVELKPIYLWQGGGFRGSVFVWVDGGQPVAVGGALVTTSQNPDAGRYWVAHEIHALSPQQIFPVLRDSETKWEPQAGVSRFPLPNGPKVADTTDERTSQLESIARDFTAQLINGESRLDLQRHPQPLYRYGDPASDVLDGALFAFVVEAQGDPEIFVAVEARRVNDAVVWHYRPIRLAIFPLTLDYQRERLWESTLSDPNSKFNNSDLTMFLHLDHYINELPPDTAPPPKP